MWQITEENEILQFKRVYNGYFIEIEIDHGPLSVNVFEGQITNSKNEIIGFVTGSSFYSVFDKLLELTRNRDEV